MEQSLEKIYSFLRGLNNKYKKYIQIIKAFVTVGFVAYILLHIDPHALVETFFDIDIRFFSLTLFVTFLTTLFYNLRYLDILDRFTIWVTFWRLYLINRLANLLNFFLPGGLGQEVGRLLYIQGKKKVFISSIIDRFVGLVSVVVTLLVSLYFVRIPLVYSAIIVLVGLFLAIVFIYGSRKLKLRLYKALFFSVIYTFLLVVMAFFQFRTVGLEVDFPQLLFFVSMVNIALMLPISIQGYGLREYLWFIFLAIPIESVLAYTLIGYVINLALSLPGLLILFEKKDDKSTPSGKYSS